MYWHLRHHLQQKSCVVIVTCSLNSLLQNKVNHQPGQLEVEQSNRAANQNENLPGNQDQVLPVPGEGERIMDDVKQDSADKVEDKQEQIVSSSFGSRIRN